jgi:hypothetical protein
MSNAERLHEALYREDMDEMCRDYPERPGYDILLHPHSKCPHGARRLEILCHHPTHILALGCAACDLAFWYWHLNEDGEYHDDEPGAEPCTWGWRVWDEFSEGYECSALPICHPEQTEITYIKALGVVEVRCTLGCRRPTGYVRYAIRSRADEKVQ